MIITGIARVAKVILFFKSSKNNTRIFDKKKARSGNYRPSSIACHMKKELNKFL